jgi:NTP pyrophosphatase (non-canonical NTP hydrolase)
MNSKEFINLALKTESNDFEKIISRLDNEKALRLLHASMGLVTEAAEIMDALKKYIFYGKPVDVVNIKEELGDSFWYKAIAVDELGTSFDEIWDMVIAKLKSRYGDKFNEEGALNRNLEVERNILEGKE